MKVEVPESVGGILTGMLASSKEVGAILTAFMAGKELQGKARLHGSFTIEIEDVTEEQ